MLEPVRPVTLDEIRAARERIAKTILRTPLVRLQADASAEIYLKLENLQPIGSFKIRGALNVMAHTPRDRLERPQGAQRGKIGAGHADLNSSYA